MITSSLDILYLVLAACAGIITIVLSMFLIRITRMLKQTQDLLLLAEQVLESIDRYVKLPARAAFGIAHKLHTLQEYWQRRKHTK